jgi:hypothetical protein
MWRCGRGSCVIWRLLRKERPGKPIVACRKVQVAVELAAPEDQEVLRRAGLAEMDRVRWPAWPARLRCRAGC